MSRSRPAVPPSSNTKVVGMKRSSACFDVVAAIIWREGRYLAVRRPPGKAMAGMWEFPGGKIEAGESPRAALARELREELGLFPTCFAFWKEVYYVYPDHPVRLAFFPCVGVSRGTGGPGGPGNVLAHPGAGPGLSLSRGRYGRCPRTGRDGRTLVFPRRRLKGNA